MLFPEEASRTFDDLKKWNPLINKPFFKKKLNIDKASKHIRASKYLKSRKSILLK